MTQAPLRFFLYMVATAIAVLILLCLLPDNRYLRFQSVTDPAVVKSSWVYERIHFDPSPIDIAFIGTSHTVFGIDSVNVEQACRAAGGAHCASVNFALQHLGRDLHWLFAREALEFHPPKLLIIDVQENEPRAMHPAFPFLANAGDIVGAPLIVNTSYFDDIVRLPLRQMTQFPKSRLPLLFGGRTAFDPKLYRGSHWDDTYSEAGSIEHPINQPRSRTRFPTLAEIETERRHLNRMDGASIRLPASMDWLEHRANLIYVERMVALARRKNVQVRFLYMPTFRGSPSANFQAFYEKLAPVWRIPPEIYARRELWLDVAHLNHAGATVISQWLGQKIAANALSTEPQNR